MSDKKLTVYYDFEFLEAGSSRPLRPISLGLVTGDGRELYLEFTPTTFESFYREWIAGLPEWHQKNVVPHLQHYNRRCECIWSKTEARFGLYHLHLETPSADCPLKDLETQQERILAFLDGATPRPVGYYADYDHVLWAQLWGTMMDLPKGWPQWTYDLKQLCWELGDPRIPDTLDGATREHNALADARWNRALHAWLWQYAQQSVDYEMQLVPHRQAVREVEKAV